MGVMGEGEGYLEEVGLGMESVPGKTLEWEEEAAGYPLLWIEDLLA